MAARALSASFTFFILERALGVNRSEEWIIICIIVCILVNIYVVVVVLLLRILLIALLPSIGLALSIIRNVIAWITIKLLLMQRIPGAVEVHEVASGASRLNHHHIFLAGASCLDDRVWGVAVVTPSCGLYSVVMTGVTI